MEFNGPMDSRPAWQTPTTVAHEPQDHMFINEFQPTPLFSKQAPEPNMTTPVDSLGIQYWPSSMNTSNPRPAKKSRPKTIHEGAFPNYSVKYPKPSSWNTYGIQMPQQYTHPQQGGGAFSELTTTFESIDGTLKHHKPIEDQLDLQAFDFDFPPYSNEVVPPDDNTPIINLRKYPSAVEEPLSLDTNFNHRLSGSSFSMSSTGPLGEVSDLSAYSEVPSYTSDYTPRSSLTFSAAPLSPVPSPRCSLSQQDIFRAGSRSRASPSPRPTMRSAPYTIDGGRNKRWSTGSYGSSPARRTSPFVYSATDGYFPPPIPGASRINSPFTPTNASLFNSNNNTLLPSSNLGNLTKSTNIYAPPPRFHRSSMLLPSTYDSTNRFENLSPVPAHGLFRTLESNADAHDHHLDHYADLADPPDLFGPLSEDQIPPPEEDMTPTDPDLIPHEQDLRFEHDLYTPRWVRGHGNKREGWCGICKPGRWLVLKNSAFWYDKSFTHGISAATGQAFEGPKDTRRMDGNLDVWEGLCGSCGEWIALVSSKKKGTTWFRHAYKCHTHPKIKDAPKRRRESSNCRPSTANSVTKVKYEPLTPAMSATSLVGDIGSGTKTISPLQSISSMI